MEGSITWVGIDAHKKTLAVAAFADGSKVPDEFTVDNTESAIRKLARRLTRTARGKEVHTARLVDAYANCFVKRNHGSKIVEPRSGANIAPPALRMSDIERRDDKGSDKDGAPCT